MRHSFWALRFTTSRYAESAKAYQRCLEIRPDDPVVLNNAGLSLAEAGDYRAAEPLNRRALAIGEKALGPDHPSTTAIRRNLETLLEHESTHNGKPLP
jgi:tetratricopeptide (TPR) repeat protein